MTCTEDDEDGCASSSSHTYYGSADLCGNPTQHSCESAYYYYYGLMYSRSIRLFPLNGVNSDDDVSGAVASISWTIVSNDGVDSVEYMGGSGDTVQACGGTQVCLS